MEKNASSAGVQAVGGLFNTAEIKILICYILNAIPEPVPADMLSNTLHYEGIANVFEVSDAITSLIENKHITLWNEKEDTYVITDSGRGIAGTLEASLSYSVKERALTAALKMVSRFRNSKETDFSLSKENGRTYITCSALDNNGPFLSVKLLVTDNSQAELIKEKFLNDPSQIYSGIINLLTSSENK